MRIKASVTIVGISAVIATNSISAVVPQPSYVIASAAATPLLSLQSGAAEVLPLTNLTSETVAASDTDGVFEIDLVKGEVGTDEADQVEPEDSDPVFDIEPEFSDFVTVTDAQFTVSFSDKVDFDPSTPAVDATPVTITEADAKEVTVADLADNDDVSITESISNQPDIPKSDTVAATDAAPVLHPQPAYDDTITAADAVDDFDVDKVLADSVSVTEAIENEVTLPSVADSVTAVQSNLKTFNSSVDFDPSDDDVDPDPITVSEGISEFDFDKGLTDTPTVTESAAMDVTVAELADNDATSVTESIALDPESVLTDSLTAVEGIKLEPDIPLSDTASATEAAVLDIRPPQTDTVSATEAINTTLTLGESEYVYPDIVYMSDGEENFVQDRFRFNRLDFTAQVNSGDMLLNSAVLWGGATDDVARASFTGVIGSDGFIGQVVMNADTISYPDESNAGLVVNFHYTDVDEDDRALGGYYFNQTPINAGNSIVGAREIL